MIVKIMKMHQGNIDFIMTAEKFQLSLDKELSNLLVDTINTYKEYIKSGIDHHFAELNINNKKVKCIPLWLINKEFKGLHLLFTENIEGEF